LAKSTHTKEEFYVLRLFDDDVPLFVDATKYVRQNLPFPLSAKKSLKATCGVRTDDEVVAFSLRNYTARQAEKEIEHVASGGDGKAAARNLLVTRMPRKTLHSLNESARSLAVVLGDEVIAELDGELYVLTLSRTGVEDRLSLTAKLSRVEDRYVWTAVEEPDVWFELPVTGVRLRVFLRSPVRDRILAYGFAGYLTRKPGEAETVTRATAMALNSVLGLATFRMLSALAHVDVPPLPSTPWVRTPAERVGFTVPVLLFTEEGALAARGHVAAEIDLDRLDPVTGALQFHLAEGADMEWNPAVAGMVAFPAYERVLTDTIAAVVQRLLGPETVNDMAYDIMLSDLSEEAVAGLRAATTDLPGLTATPRSAEIRPVQPV
jgi:hypothetical protein